MAAADDTITPKFSEELTKYNKLMLSIKQRDRMVANSGVDDPPICRKTWKFYV